MNCFLATVALAIVFTPAAHAMCPVSRAKVKSVTDANAAQVNAIAFPGVIALLRTLPSTRPLPQDGRIAPTENTIYSVTATLVAYRLTTEDEIELVLSDDQRRTIIATIPSADCGGGAASRFYSAMSGARAEFERRLTPSSEYQEIAQPVEVQGVGFFNFMQGQRGLAPNGLSLYPVTSIDFTPSFQPKPPPAPVRRRAAGIGTVRTCSLATLALSTSRVSSCAGEAVTVAWQSSDPIARVTIDGIGTSLPASGNRVVNGVASAAYSGRAITSCGTSNEAVAVVNVQPVPTASLTGPVAISNGDTTTLSVTVTGVSSWTLTSSLGNGINPSSGTSSRTVTYTATRNGIDTLTLSTNGNGCAAPTRSISISISAPPPTGGNPPPGNSGLRCCDGTRSPSCFSCSNKQGCCSSHGGVCGCG
ncbi:MAG TPA: hypothetical protein VF787_27440 [Thermoanaerobaculia bacterium]